MENMAGVYSDITMDYKWVKNLSAAIVLQAVTDYYKITHDIIGEDNQCNKREIERFFFSDWFELMSDLDPNDVINKLKNNEINLLK